MRFGQRWKQQRSQTRFWQPCKLRGSRDQIELALVIFILIRFAGLFGGVNLGRNVFREFFAAHPVARPGGSLFLADAVHSRNSIDIHGCCRRSASATPHTVDFGRLILGMSGDGAIGLPGEPA
jgi:hypothetical protein